MWKPVCRVLSCALIALPLTMTQSVAQPAAQYPSKPVKIIVPFPAGGTTDAITRLVAEKLSAKWGQTVVVDNRPGAGGNIGASMTARSDPDGLTLMSTPPGPLAINFNLYKDLNYDAKKFVPVSMLANMPNVLVVGPSVKANSLKELIAYGKANPGKLTFASQGVGSTSHLTAILFQTMAGITMLHVPYKGSSPALTDMIGGKIDLMFDNVTTSLPFHQAKRVRILAVAANSRISTVPEVPTTAEAGMPDFESGTWVAMAAPAGTPQDIVEKINRDVDAIVKLPEIIQKFADLGAQPVGGTTAEMAAFVKAESAKWEKVIQTAHVTAE